jgi:hypothetical protein
MMSYWDEEVHPALYPKAVRDAWHQDAWNKEQAELQWLAQGLRPRGGTTLDIDPFGPDEN